MDDSNTIGSSSRPQQQEPRSRPLPEVALQPPEEQVITSAASVQLCWTDSILERLTPFALCCMGKNPWSKESKRISRKASRPGPVHRLHHFMEDPKGTLLAKLSQ